MKQWAIDLLTRLLTMLQPHDEGAAVIVAPIDPLDQTAMDLVKAADGLSKTASGEYKRHWVYAQLLKQFPDRRKRDASLAIELAVQARGD